MACQEQIRGSWARLSEAWTAWTSYKCLKQSTESTDTPFCHPHSSDHSACPFGNLVQERDQTTEELEKLRQDDGVT